MTTDGSERCPTVPTQGHTWVFEYDEPHFACHYCGEVRDYEGNVVEDQP